MILAAWQVTLFLQPEILKKEPLSTLSQQSCDYLYCPPLRTPVVLSNQVNAISPGQWELKLQDPESGYAESEAARYSAHS